MEATGYYHYALAQFLVGRGRIVSVLNPLPVKRLIQMKLSKMKTDKTDAKMICEYAMANDTPFYNSYAEKAGLAKWETVTPKLAFPL